MAEYDLTKITPETWRRIDRAEELLTSEPGMTIKKARRLLAKEWGIANRNAGRVLEIWAQIKREERDQTLEERKAEMGERLQYFQRKAIKRQGALFNPADGCIATFESPDVGAATRAAELECRLYGLLEQDGSANVLVVNGEINLETKILQAMQQVYGLTPGPEKGEEDDD